MLLISKSHFYNIGLPNTLHLLTKYTEYTNQIYCNFSYLCVITSKWTALHILSTCCNLLVTQTWSQNLRRNNCITETKAKYQENILQKCINERRGCGGFWNITLDLAYWVNSLILNHVIIWMNEWMHIMCQYYFKLKIIILLIFITTLISRYHFIMSPHLKVRVQNNRKIEILKSQTVNNWCSKHSHPGLLNSVMP